MKAIDKIIGYTGIKRELMQIGDILKNREAYEKLGVASPRGLLLFGEPGVGKSLMAAAVIEESGRMAFTCRKDKPNGDFVNHIKETFDKAAESAPSIVFLDDMDKFANGDERHPDAEEYVTVQSCIDEIKSKGKEVFVLATVNNINNLPRSLYRAGRFDRIIEVETPRGQDAEDIVAYYLSNKKFVEDVDTKTIARIMNGRSCAELETVINEAGLYAGYDRAESITMDHFIEACMRTVYNVTSMANDDDYYSVAMDTRSIDYRVVCHEVGHAVVSEILCPESVTLICAYSRSGNKGGFTDYYNDCSKSPLYWKKSRVVSSLGGMAAVEQIFGVCDDGNTRDLDQAFNVTNELVVNNCICGFHLHQNGYQDSQHLWSLQEQAVSAEIEKYYKKAKEILACNKEFFDKLVAALFERGFLMMSDIKEIKESCKIISVAL